MRRPASPEMLAQALRDVAAGRYGSTALESSAGWHHSVLDALFEASRTDPAAEGRLASGKNANRMFGGTWSPPALQVVIPVAVGVSADASQADLPAIAAMQAVLPVTAAAAIEAELSAIQADLPAMQAVLPVTAAADGGSVVG